MDTATTARRESTAPAGVLYVGLELSAREWRLACSGGLATRGMQTVIRAGDRPGWQRAIGRAKRRYGLAASAPVWALALGPEASVGARCGNRGRCGCLLWDPRPMPALAVGGGVAVRGR